MTDVRCIGHTSWDIAMAIGRQPDADEKLVADVMQLCDGSPCRSLCGAIGWQRCFLRSSVGRVMFGEAHLHELAASAVNHLLMEQPGETVNNKF